MMTSPSRIVLASLASLLVAAAVAGCDMLQMEPSQSISDEVALTSQQDFEALLTATYDRPQTQGWYGQEFFLGPEALADNITVTDENGNRYPAEVSNEPGVLLGQWSWWYETINQANNLIARIGNLEEASQDFQRRIEGEARFLRALTYHDLMRNYAYTPGMVPDECNQEVCDQGVVLRTEPTRAVADADTFHARAPIEEVYRQIEADLQESIQLLDGNSRGNQFYASQASAQALLARVYLYWRRWEEAEQFATDALGSIGEVGAEFVSGDEYVAAFEAETNPEGIFVMDMTQAQDGDVTNGNGAPAALTTPGNFAFEVIPTQDDGVVGEDGAYDEEADDPATDDLLAAYNHEEDVRFDLYETTTKVGQEVFYTRKYVDTEAPFVTNMPVIRVSELYLIRAEARAEQGDVSGAQEDLNTIRERAGLDPVAPEGEALIDAILEQKRLEFAMEGHRFFDLKRRGRDIVKPQDRVSRGMVSYENYLMLDDLPSGEVQSNPNLLQNRGY